LIFFEVKLSFRYDGGDDEVLRVSAAAVVVDDDDDADAEAVAPMVVLVRANETASCFRKADIAPTAEGKENRPQRECKKKEKRKKKKKHHRRKKVSNMYFTRISKDKKPV
jgi:hypothetical protein